ncbi:glutamate formimidoyltransferase [Pelotomaculum propionicicum]|uniref:glutamate formimidoyltransferase n=1 Tax=Pelotomaculum propionicicum TaxID=258475 RepID=UPI003B8165E6
MKKLVECVPNFSEGRRPEVIAEILGAIRETVGVQILDCSSDASHNRSVITFLGGPDEVKRAAFQAAARAKDLIDLTAHRGEHPRMGAVDVIPFVPVEGISMEECVELARQLGSEIAAKLDIPVYLYEAAATRPERKNLADVRRGEFEGLRETIGLEEKMPDFGPARVHPTAGAVAVGARPPLIAYNVNLATSDLGIAKKIAKSIRGSSGGYPSIKALGVILDDRNIAQVSINVCNFREVSLPRVFETVKREAERCGVNVTGSEIVGLVPQEALVDAAEYYLRLENFNKDQVLENRLK